MRGPATRRSNFLAWFNDAFSADVIKVEDAAELARTLNNDDEVALAMHRVLRGRAELIIDHEGITVATPSHWNETPDAAWRLVVAVDRLLTPERRAL